MVLVRHWYADIRGGGIPESERFYVGGVAGERWEMSEHKAWELALSFANWFKSYDPQYTAYVSDNYGIDSRVSWWSTNPSEM